MKKRNIVVSVALVVLVLCTAMGCNPIIESCPYDLRHEGIVVSYHAKGFKVGQLACVEFEDGYSIRTAKIYVYNHDMKRAVSSDDQYYYLAGKECSLYYCYWVEGYGGDTYLIVPNDHIGDIEKLNSDIPSCGGCRN